MVQAAAVTIAVPVLQVVQAIAAVVVVALILAEAIAVVVVLLIAGNPFKTTAQGGNIY